MKYCTNCGSPLDDNAAVCYKCGKPLNNVDAPQQAAPTTPAEKVSAFGIIAFILSIIGFMTGFLRIGVAFDVVAIILAIIVLIKSKRKPTKKGLPIAGISVAAVSLIFMAIIYGGNFISNWSEIRNVEKHIDNIGQVTVDSKDSITAAEEEYNKLSDEQKEKVDNYDVLTTARADYDAIEEKASLLTQLNSAYESSDWDTVVSVADKIISGFSGSEEANQATALKSEAEVKLNEERSVIKEKGKAALPRLISNYDNVQHLTWYKPQSAPEYTNSRCAFYFYLGKRDDDGGKDSGAAWLRLKATYVGDDWIFFKNIQINVNGQTIYTVNPNYFDILHEVGNGKVWESLDCTFPENNSWILSDEQRSVIEQIRDSSEAIIRFQGDHYRYDYTVTNEEKRGIGDILDAYDYLRSL